VHDGTRARYQQEARSHEALKVLYETEVYVHEEMKYQHASIIIAHKEILRTIDEMHTQVPSTIYEVLEVSTSQKIDIVKTRFKVLET